MKHSNTKKLYQCALDITKQVQEYAQGVILCGSVAYSPEYDVKPTSDLDMIIVTEQEKLQNILNAEALNTHGDDVEKMMDLAGSLDIQNYTLKYENRSNQTLNLHIMPYETLLRICSDEDGAVRSFRCNQKEGFYRLKSLDGNELLYPIDNEVYSDGVICKIPRSAVDENARYFGNHHDKLLSNSIPLYSRNGHIKNGYNMLWDNVTRRCDSICETERKNLTDALVRQHRFRPDIKDTINARMDYEIGRRD